MTDKDRIKELEFKVEILKDQVKIANDIEQATFKLLESTLKQRLIRIDTKVEYIYG